MGKNDKLNTRSTLRVSKERDKEINISFFDNTLWNQSYSTTFGSRIFEFKNRLRLKSDLLIKVFIYLADRKIR